MAEAQSQGRPTKYNPEYDEQAYKLSLLGAIDLDIAEFFDVAESTLYLWKQEYPSFSEAIKRGKIEADANVTQSLYRRANGFSHPDTHISNFQGSITVTDITKHYPPDTTACIYWLNNRQRKYWKNSNQIELSGKDGGPIQTEDITDPNELARRIAFALAQNAPKE